MAITGGQDELRQAAQLLVENRWVTRKDMPDEYLLVRRNEKALRQFFRDKCGWPLLVTPQFYKLEKIPANPRSFMGIEAMQSVEDYVLLACVMAFLEEYEAGGQFLLGDLAEALLSYYPEDAYTPKLNWESYNWRKSLIRVLKYLADEGILQIVDDESVAFLSQGYGSDGNIAGEALYEVTTLARYFLRNFPQELGAYDSLAELGAADFMPEIDEEATALRQRRHRLYREVLLSPVYYRDTESEGDFLYLRKRHGRLEEAMLEWFGLHVELYQDAVMAVSHEQSSWVKDSFPVRFRGLHDVLLHFAHYWREVSPQVTSLSKTEWQVHMEKLQAAVGHGWTKEYREMSVKRLAENVLAEMTAWGMAKVAEDGLITLLPALLRYDGSYPTDYQPGKSAKRGKTEDKE